MFQSQAPYQLPGEAKINLVVVMEVRELLSLVEERCATCHLGRKSLQPFDFMQLPQQLLLQRSHGLVLARWAFDWVQPPNAGRPR